MTSKELGECLKEARTEHGLNQNDIAEKLGIPVATYGNYERGTRDPNIEFITSFCDTLGITVGELLKESNPKWKHLPSNLQRLFKKLINTDAQTQEETERYVDFCEDGKQQKAKGKNVG